MPEAEIWQQQLFLQENCSFLSSPALRIERVVKFLDFFVVFHGCPSKQARNFSKILTFIVQNFPASNLHANKSKIFFKINHILTDLL
jgi:hypothetical protein